MVDFYGTAAGFTTYHEARARDVSAYDDADILPALLVGSEFLDGAFREQFYGYKLGLQAQVREWPRTGVTDYYGYGVPDNVVPVAIENATYEIALRELRTPGATNTDATPNKYKRVSIDGALSVEYANQDAMSLQLQMPVLAQILQPLIGVRGGSTMALSSKTVRA